MYFVSFEKRTSSKACTYVKKKGGGGGGGGGGRGGQVKVYLAPKIPHKK